MSRILKLDSSAILGSPAIYRGPSEGNTFVPDASAPGSWLVYHA